MLLFGGWHSHAGLSVNAPRFAQALTSEIVGWPALSGVKTSSRIDPLGIQNKFEIYATEDSRWTFGPERAARDAKGRPARTRPSEVGHGNIAPVVDRATGGVSIQRAPQTAVLSLVRLRQLRFPGPDGRCSEARDRAAQVVLAALALVALSEQYVQGYQLRSGCLLQPVDEPLWKILGRTAREDRPAEAVGDLVPLLRQALEEAERYGLAWPEEPVTLQASPDLVELVRQNDALVAAPREGEA